MANPSGANQTLTKIYESVLNAIRVKVVGSTLPDGAATEATLVLIEDNTDSSHGTGASTRPSINNVSSTILAANSARRYAAITNNNAFTAYLKLGVAAVVDQGIPLPPGGRYEITMTNLWTGDIRAIKSTSIAANLDVFEGTS